MHRKYVSRYEKCPLVSESAMDTSNISPVSSNNQAVCEVVIRGVD